MNTMDMRNASMDTENDSKHVYQGKKIKPQNI